MECVVNPNSLTLEERVISLLSPQETTRYKWLFLSPLEYPQRNEE